MEKKEIFAIVFMVIMSCIALNWCCTHISEWCSVLFFIAAVPVLAYEYIKYENIC